MVLMMDIDGVLDGAPIGAAGMVRGERAPTDDLVVLDGDGDGMFGAVMSEPMVAALEWLRLFLISASGGEDVMIVDVVDGLEIGFDGKANENGAGSKFWKRIFLNWRLAFSFQGFEFC